MHMILAVALEVGTSKIVRAWWRPGVGESSWTGPAVYVDLADVANAVRAGHAVFARVKRGDCWVLGPSVMAGVDDRGRASIYFEGSPESVDEALTWLSKNWCRREVHPE